MKEICAKELCTGCTACMTVCPRDSISMVPDDYGFLYPTIDVSKCISCELCTKVCPASSFIEKRLPEFGYACHAKSMEEQFSSTSGGAISVISRYVLRAGGIVYGCSWTSDNTIEHIRVAKENELDKLKGSKYVQSNLGHTFRAISDDLKRGTLVLFVGTPCQVAGLKSYLHKDYSNLYTADFVCHGVPSQAYLKEALYSIRSNKGELPKRIEFRYKHVPFFYKSLPNAIKSRIRIRSTYGLHFIDKDEHLVYSETYPYNNYILGFLTGLTYRESCYYCKYATPERVSDFTCGDYYDEALLKSLPGAGRLASMLTANSTKAESLFLHFSPYLEAVKVEYSDILESHKQLTKPMPLHPCRSEFLRVYPRMSFDKAIDCVMGEEKKRIIRNQRLDRVARIVYSIPLFRKLRNK